MKLNRSAAALWVGSIFALLSLATSAAEPERVRVTTNLGAFVVEVQRDRAPLTAENFLGYVKQGYYTNTLFHRVIANFLIQGGGVGPDYKAKPTQKPIANEAGNGLKNRKYSVAMARTGDPHSATAQFFINVADNAFLDYKGPSPQGWGYAVFGKVVEGTDTVDKIKAVATGRSGMHENVPTEDVVIQKAEALAS